MRALTTTTQIPPKTRLLTPADIQSLNLPAKLTETHLIIDHSFRGWPLKQPVSIQIYKILATREKGLVEFILRAFVPERPRLIPLMFENQSLIQLARHFLRHCSGSPQSLYSYTDSVSRYAGWLGQNPDVIISDVKPGGNIPDPTRVANHQGFLEDYLASLQDEGLAPSRVHGAIKHIRTFYRCNLIDIKLREPLSRRVTYKDRAPTPEELTHLLEIADLRGKVIISMLALGGFRESTLAQLQYRHIREDMEAGRIPIHVHVEAEITKGKYHEYDSFLGAEAAEYLRLYMKQRQNEPLNDESPLIRDAEHTPRPIGAKQIRKIVHRLYAKAGLLKPPRGRMYELRVHSLRKYFKTQLLALGMQPDYVDYMMGHTIDTYHDIEMKGIEYLRNIYASSGLSIKPKTQTSKIETLKTIIRSLGMNPDQVLTREALSLPARTYLNYNEREDQQLQILTETLRDLIRKETAAT